MLLITHKLYIYQRKIVLVSVLMRNIVIFQHWCLMPKKFFSSCLPSFFCPRQTFQLIQMKILLWYSRRFLSFDFGRGARGKKQASSGRQVHTNVWGGSIKSWKMWIHLEGCFMIEGMWRLWGQESGLPSVKCSAPRKLSRGCGRRQIAWSYV